MEFSPEVILFHVDIDTRQFAVTFEPGLNSSPSPVASGRCLDQLLLVMIIFAESC